MTKPYDIDERTIAQSSPALASPINLGAGSTASRPALKSSGYFNDTTVGKRIYWDARSQKWRDQNGLEA